MSNNLLKQVKDNIPLIYEAGKTKGIKEMQPQLEEKYNAGYDNGYEVGYNKGYDQGKIAGADEEMLQAKYNEGFEGGKNAGIKEGQQIEYNNFWDSVQKNGDLTAYENVFSGRGWNNITFKPKYSMQPTGAYMMFRYNQYQGSLIELLKQQNITMDFSKCTSANYCFSYSQFTEIGVLDLRKFNKNKIAQMFQGCSKLKKIEKILITDTVGCDSGFASCGALEEVIFEGVIGQKGFSFASCKLLNKASIESIINCLKVETDTTSELSIGFSLQAVNNAFKTAEGLADGSTSEEWTNLIATKPNWTITLT